MPSKLVFNARFFSPEDIQLASLIPNIKEPDLDSLECPIPFGRDDITVREFLDVQTYFRSREGSSLHAFFSKLLKLSSDRERSSDRKISSQAGREYTLKKPKSMFKRLCEEPEARNWLQEQLEEGLDVYFVVGFCTLYDAEASGGAKSSSQQSGQITIPVSEIATAVPVEALDVGFGGNRFKAHESRNHFVAPGEQIFEIRVKKLSFRVFESHEVDNVRLSKNASYWKVTLENRGSTGPSEYIEASFEDELDKDPEQESESSEGDDGDVEISFVGEE